MRCFWQLDFTGQVFTDGESGTMGEESSNNTNEQSVLDQLTAVVALAKQGNAEVLPELRDLLDEHPEIWKHYGDLSGQVTAKWLDLLAGDDVLIRESVFRQVNELRSELQAEGASPLETLLVERVIASWLQVRYFDAAVTLATEDVPAVQGRYMQQQLDRAQKRHIEAVRALAEVRKLLPVVL